MIYSTFDGRKGSKEVFSEPLQISKLAFGAMRLPLLADGKSIDADTTFRMVDQAMAAGVNYYDTAYPYHGGLSEVVLCNALRRYPSDSYFLADKYPGHQTADTYDPAAVFEDQLKKCGVDYFDFYLLHNVTESCIDVYLSDRWKIVDYFVEQRRKGRIRHLGFSSHASLPTLKRWLESPQGKEMEFCQIQLNYVDWTLQQAKEKCALLAAYGLPIWVMEPVRGGKLATLPDDLTARLRAQRPDESTAAWAFRWLQTVPDVTVVLSGMSSPEQMNDNLKTFSTERPLTEAEVSLLQDEVAARLNKGIPCTACRYCCDGCPMELDIPRLLSTLNDLRFENSLTPSMYIESLPDDKKPTACLSCGACADACPQGIAIPDLIQELNERMEKAPKWSEICKERNEIARRLANGIDA